MTTQKTVVVTGASSGIGQATAGLLAQRGYRVFGTARDPEQTASVPEGVEFLPLDVTLDGSVGACVDAVLERTGRIDVLVNNAGYALVGSVEAVSAPQNMLFMEPGGFRFSDYVKVGLPMLLLTMLVTVALAKVIYLPG